MRSDTNVNDVHREVIRDHELRRLAEGHSHQTVHVLVEPRQATAGHTVLRGRQTTAPGPVQVWVPAHRGTGDEKWAGDITRVTGRRPHYLRAAGAFVAVASGDQLALLATLPWVAAIRPCRRVSVPPARTVETQP